MFAENLSDKACNQAAKNGGLQEFKETSKDLLVERADGMRRAVQYGKSSYSKVYEESRQLMSSNTALSRVLNCEPMMRSLCELLMFGDHFRRGQMFKVSHVSAMIRVYGGVSYFQTTIICYGTVLTGCAVRYVSTEVHVADHQSTDTTNAGAVEPL